MSGKELLHHLFDWEVAPGITRSDDQDGRTVVAAAPCPTDGTDTMRRS